MTIISAGISQIGGKYRLRKTLLEYTPYHEFFLSMFSGACWYELNKPRCRYECFNDKDSEFINYLLTIRKYPIEFDKMKKGVFGLVSQDICNKIVNGKLKPRNDIERAYFFYYLNKLTYASSPSKGFAGIIDQKRTPYNLRASGIKEAKSNYRGITLPTVCKEKSINEAKASYKGINPKTTRPFSNNDCGLLTPLDKKAIERLRYVNLTCYDFRKVYELFFKAFYLRKGLTLECFIYADPPYPGTEKYYFNGSFSHQHHLQLININLHSPFHFMLSIGGNCDFYIKAFTKTKKRREKFHINEVYTKYSTDSNSQNPSKEYIITNFNIKKVPRMIMDNQINLTKYIEV